MQYNKLMPRHSALRKRLLEEIPVGQIVTRRFLRTRDYSGHMINNLLRSGTIVALARGVYAQGAPLTVPGIVHSLQRMGNDLVVGGETAMRLHGVLGAAPGAPLEKVTLSGYDRLPAWFGQVDTPCRFERQSIGRLLDLDRPGPGESLDTDAHFVQRFELFGMGFWMTRVERALFEVLSEVPEQVSFQKAWQLVDRAAGRCSPRILRRILDRSVNVKANRLILWLAEMRGLDWFQGLELGRYIGSGKRQLVRGGRYVRKYRMTVPRGFPPSRPPA